MRAVRTVQYVPRLAGSVLDVLDVLDVLGVMGRVHRCAILVREGTSLPLQD